MKNTYLPSTRSGIHHACMPCSVGVDLHACVYELASCLEGAAGSQICQSGAAMPDRLAPLLATNRLLLATVIMFALQNRSCTRSRPPHTQGGNQGPFWRPIFVVSRWKIKMFQNVPNGFRAFIGVNDFFLGAKTDFGAHLGTFLAPLGPRVEVRGGENAKIEHFGKSS